MWPGVCSTSTWQRSDRDRSPPTTASWSKAQVLGRSVQVAGARPAGQGEPTGHVVVVQMGLGDVGDLHAGGVGGVEHPVDVSLRVDHQRRRRRRGRGSCGHPGTGSRSSRRSRWLLSTLLLAGTRWSGRPSGSYPGSRPPIRLNPDRWPPRSPCLADDRALPRGDNRPPERGIRARRPRAVARFRRRRCPCRNPGAATRGRDPAGEGAGRLAVHDHRDAVHDGGVHSLGPDLEATGTAGKVVHNGFAPGIDADHWRTIHDRVHPPGPRPGAHDRPSGGRQRRPVDQGPEPAEPRRDRVPRLGTVGLVLGRPALPRALRPVGPGDDRASPRSPQPARPHGPAGCVRVRRRGVRPRHPPRAPARARRSGPSSPGPTGSSSTR